MIATLFIIDSSAQKRKRTRRRSSAPRITNPAIYPPANENAGEATAGDNNQAAQPSPNPDNPEEMRRTIRGLSNQVDKLNDKLSQMEESQRSLIDLERLSRAEQRATALRAELGVVQQKQADLQAHLEDVDYALKPENIERAVVGYGSTRPEEVRAQRQRQLQSERERVSKQLEQLASSEAHLNEAIAATDAEVERLRKRLDETDKAQIENTKTKSQTSSDQTSTPTPRPSPTP
jgi:DNA repair exonuclease SbcCD ATPase subunit